MYHPGTCIFLPWFDWTRVGEIPVETVRKFDQLDPAHSAGSRWGYLEGEKVERLRAAGKRVVGTLSANAPEQWSMPDDEFRGYVQRYAANVKRTYVVEVGNEPGLLVMQQYLRKLRVASEVLRADGRRVLMGAPWPDATLGYIDGAAAAGAFDLVDGVCAHVYASTPERSLERVRAIRARLASHGAAEMPLHVTEWGWATDGQPGHNLVVTEAQQRDYLTRGFGYWREHARELGLHNMLWYLYNDWSGVEGVTTPPKRWKYNAGVVRMDGTRKPSYDALARVGEGG